jgi:drug/metabolite transporter (DMT)-like permease
MMAMRPVPSPAVPRRLPTRVRAARAHVPSAAIAYITGAVLCFTILDAITKFTTQHYSVPLLIWARYGVQFVLMLAWLAPRMGRRLLRTEHLRLQLFRAAILLTSSFFFVTALRFLPLAETTALNYTTPIIVVLMSGMLLGEAMTRARVMFVVAGAVGMLMIVQPGSEVFHGAALLGICAAIFYAGYQITTRMLADEDPLVLLFYPALFGTAVLTALTPTFAWSASMPWTHVLLIVCAGLFGTSGHFLLILAFRLAPASALTPFTYMQLVFAMVFGWVLYGDFPNAVRVAGMAVIAGSGLVMTLYERQRTRALLADPVTIQ